MTIRWVQPEPYFLVAFPTSISERGDRVAAIVSIENNCERACSEWLVIKHVRTDKLEHEIRLVDMELSDNLGAECPYAKSTCEPMLELERRVEAANAVLTQDRWRPVSCYFGTRQPDRMEPGCEELFAVMEVDFKNGRPRVVHQGRVLVNEPKPSWVYLDPSPGCKPYSETLMESVAIDLETGVLVMGLKFSAQIEGCSEPRWDIHPMKLPTLRRKAAPGHDGGPP